MNDRIITSSEVVLKKVKPEEYLGKVGYMADTISSMSLKKGQEIFQSLCIGFGSGGFRSATGLAFKLFQPEPGYKDSGEYTLRDILHIRSKGILDLIGKEVYFGEDPLILLKQINRGEAQPSKLTNINASSKRYPFKLEGGLGCVIVRRHDGQKI